MTICPCCGFKFNGVLSNGCQECGARSVGEPLPKPAHELPSYGRSLLLVVSGALVTIVFVVQTIAAMFQKTSLSFGFWSWVAAGETASWRLKWISLPVLFVTLWAGRKIYRSMLAEPTRFCGLKHARRGLLASSMVALLIALLIGITVPARLRQRQMSIDAAAQAQFWTLDRAFFEYQKRFKTLPDQSTVIQDLSQVSDPDGSLAAALKNFDPTGYQPRAEVAAVSKVKAPPLRGALIRNASLTSTDDTPPGGLSFTNYEIRLPGADKILGTEDDWIGRDGVIKRVSELPKGSAPAAALKP